MVVGFSLSLPLPLCSTNGFVFLCHQSRHASVNAVIKRALDLAKIPSRLEPNGIFRDDGRRPDGATLTTWKRGRILVRTPLLLLTSLLQQMVLGMWQMR